MIIRQRTPAFLASVKEEAERDCDREAEEAEQLKEGSILEEVIGVS